MIYAAPGSAYRAAGARGAAIRFGLHPTKQRERFDFETAGLFDFDPPAGGTPLVRAFLRTAIPASVPLVKRAMGLIKPARSRPRQRAPGIASRRRCWGPARRFVPLGLAKGASARLGWPLHVIEDAGHVPHIERTDRFVDALQAALGEESKARFSVSRTG